MTTLPGLRFRREGVIVAARYHDSDKLTPDLLTGLGIVPNTWKCSLIQYTEDGVDIRMGPTLWSMTPNELWITEDQESPLPPDPSERIPITAAIANRYLNKVVHVPTRAIWYYCRMAVEMPDAQQWRVQRFLSSVWPSHLGQLSIEPKVIVRLDNLIYSITINVSRNSDEVTFECFSRYQNDLGVDDASEDIIRCGPRLHTLIRMVTHILEGRAM